MRTKFKAWAEPYLKEHIEVQLNNEDLSSYKKYVLEIGSGKGDFLVSMSNKFPKLNFIGVEKNVTCAGITCKKLVENKISNGKIIWNDIEKLFPYIKKQSVKTIFLNFSDPWPKKRHFKRRLTSEKFLNEYKRILSKDGMIIFKTDNVDLFNYSLETFIESGFKIIEKTNDYKDIEEFDSITEYEASFRNEGIAINRMKVIYEK